MQWAGSVCSRSWHPNALGVGLLHWTHVELFVDQTHPTFMYCVMVQWCAAVRAGGVWCTHCHYLEHHLCVCVFLAEGNLYNPAIFIGQQPFCWDMADDYLRMVDKYPAPLSAVRGHLFKLWHKV